MRKETFNYIKAILGDYSRIDEYIKQREEELRVPYRESDLNADIKGSKASYDQQDNLMVTIEQDRRLTILERNKRIVQEALEESDDITRTIINELYIKRWPKYHTLPSLVDQKIIFVSKSKAYELRNAFFKNIADDLNL